MKKIIWFSIISLILVFADNMHAQNIEQNNLYTRNRFLINPAHTGATSRINTFLNTRRQFSGIADAPRLLSFGIHGQLSEKTGLGLMVKSERMGVLEDFSATLHYSHLAEITSGQKLVFGVFGGYGNFSLNRNRVNTANDLDPTLYDDYRKKNNFIAGAGVRYIVDNFEFDIVAPELVKGNTVFPDRYITAATYNIKISDSWLLQPSVYINFMSESKNQVDVNIMTEWQNTVWLQVSARTNDSYIFALGYNTNDFSLGYAYEYNDGNLSHISKGGHELLLQVSFDKLKRKKKSE